MKHTAIRAPRFDREWKELIAMLPEHRQALMEKAIRDYQLHGTEPVGLYGAETMAFLLIKKIVDRRAKQRRARMRRHAPNNQAEKNAKTEANPTQKSTTRPNVAPEIMHTTASASKEPSLDIEIGDNPEPYRPTDKRPTQQPRTKTDRHKAIIKRLNRISQNSNRNKNKPPKRR